jgi:hypothetical protein
VEGREGEGHLWAWECCCVGSIRKKGCKLDIECQLSVSTRTLKGQRGIANRRGGRLPFPPKADATDRSIARDYVVPTRLIFSGFLFLTGRYPCLEV